MKNITLDGVEYTPVIKQQPELPTTVEGVYDEVKPLWFLNNDGKVVKDKCENYGKDQLPTQALAEKALAYIQLLTVCHWANQRFEGDNCMWFINAGLDTKPNLGTVRDIWHTTSKAAAEYIRTHHLDLIKKFYGI